MMPRIAVSGTPRERGRQYGHAASPRIHRAVNAYRDVFHHRAGLHWNDAIEHALQFIEPIGDFAPDSLEEMRGIAEGSGVPFEAILVLNCRSELMFAASRSRGTLPPSECTSFAAAPAATANRHMLIGQNWDWLPFALEISIFLEVQRDDKPSFVTIVEAGMLAKVGMNDAGLGLCTNTLVSERDVNRIGVPYHVMLRRLLDAGSTDEAGNILRSVDRALSANYLIADSGGYAVNFETVAGGGADMSPTVPESGLLMHANHFCSADYAPLDAFVRNSPHSFTRLEDIRYGLTEAVPLNVERVQAVLRGHRNGPNGICSHPDPAAHPMFARTTVASFVADLTNGECWFTEGPPCQAKYETYRFPISKESR